MAEFNIANERMNGSPNSGIPDELKATAALDDEIFNSVGLYSHKFIQEARYSRYSRYGRVLSIPDKMNTLREYLFFVKPDLHLVVPASFENTIYSIGGYDVSNGTGSITAANGKTYIPNPQLEKDPYLLDVIQRYPQIIEELQVSASAAADPFSHLLSFSVKNTLDMPGIEFGTIDNPMTIFGNTYEYQKDTEASDKDVGFNLEFMDTKKLDVYTYFKVWSRYQTLRKRGIITPPHWDYYRYKRQHNVMGVYKFLVSEDMETLVYWAYFWGVFPTSVPRDAFSDVNYENGLDMSVSFKAAFVDDMEPTILSDFNSLMLKTNCLQTALNKNGSLKDCYLKVAPFDEQLIFANGDLRRNITGSLPKAAYVVKDDNKNRYILRWFA